MEQHMKKLTGLWIDHTRALVVTGVDSGEIEEIIQILSSIAKHIRYSGNGHASVASVPPRTGLEDGHDRHFDNLLNRYYDRVILNVRDATSILILGPGEAKYELQKRLEVHGLSDHIVAIKTAGEMTDDQLVAEVRLYFQESVPHTSKEA
jgi:hypothetical protein